MDEIQDKFGDLGELDKVMGGKDRFKAVRWLLALLLNEGAAEGESPLTEREVGKMIHAGNMAYAQECIYKSIAIGQAGKERFPPKKHRSRTKRTTKPNRETRRRDRKSRPAPPYLYWGCAAGLPGAGSVADDPLQNTDAV